MQVTWRILSKDDATRSMVVEYAGSTSAVLNIPQPTTDHDINEWVSKYAPAPVLQAREFHPVEVGHSGSFEHDTDATATSEQANVVGSWNEEYVRALIYSVLEEVRESTV